MSKQRSAEELARLGISVDVPKIEVMDDTASVEPIAETDIAVLARDEKFMAELVKIRIASTTDQNAPPFATVIVNDVTNRVQIPRGVPVYVRRMHLEVLARMRETRFTQPARNPYDPEPGNQLIPHHAWAYPFEVIEDKNPRGREWLERLMNEPTY